MALQLDKRSFPTAEGPGFATFAGREGEVRFVENRNNTGTGSFRNAVIDDNAKIIIPLLGGYIHLTSDVEIGSNTTILGGFAPSGLCFRNRIPRVSYESQVIIRHIKSRKGDLDNTSDIDAFTARDSNQVMIDHCTFSWSIDEVASFTNMGNTTIQNTMIYEPLDRSFHPDGAHGFGSIFGGDNCAMYKCILAHSYLRNPRLSGGHIGLQIVNSVFYNWQQRSTRGGSLSECALYFNYYKPGPATGAERGTTNTNRWPEAKTHFVFPLADGDDYVNNSGKFWLEGNKLVGRPEIDDDQWLGARLGSSSETIAYLELSKNKDEFGNLVPFISKEELREIYPTLIEDADQAYLHVLANAGDNLAGRDSLDTRVISEITNRTAQFGYLERGVIDSVNDITGGYPAIDNADTQLILTGSSAHKLPNWFIDKYGLVFDSDPRNAGTIESAPWRFIIFKDGNKGVQLSQYGGSFDADTDAIYNVYEVIYFHETGEIDMLEAPVGEFALTVTSTTGGSVSQDPTGSSFTAGTSITLTATADSGFVFSRYRNPSTNETLSTNAVYTFSKSATSESIQAVFVSQSVPPGQAKKFFARKKPTV